MFANTLETQKNISTTLLSESKLSHMLRNSYTESLQITNLLQITIKFVMNLVQN